MAKIFTHPPASSILYGPFHLSAGFGEDSFSEVDFSIEPEGLTLSDKAVSSDGKEAWIRVSGPGKLHTQYTLTFSYKTQGLHESSRTMLLDCEPLYV